MEKETYNLLEQLVKYKGEEIVLFYYAGHWFVREEGNIDNETDGVELIDALKKFQEGKGERIFM